MIEIARTGTLISATMAMGIAAGVFQLYSYAIMPGLGRTDDRTFVGAFQQIDRAIINPWWMLSFFGALILTAAAAGFHFGVDERSILLWIGAAFILYLAVVIVTLVINVPLNDAIKAAGDPDGINLATVRDHFHEARWVAWNLFRALATGVAFSCLIWALALHGRA